MATQEDTNTQDDAVADAVDLDNLPDGRIEDRATFAVAFDALIHAAGRAVTEWQRATNAAKTLAAARVNVRAMIVREKNGFPDWGADSDAYKVVVTDAENVVLAKLGTDGKNRLQAAVRQHVKRSMMLPAIVSYCLSHGGDEKLAAEGERWGAETNLVDLTAEQLAVLSDPSSRLVSAVRKHYKAAGLTLPDGPFAYDQAEKSGSGGPDEAEKVPSPLGALETALSGLSQIVPKYGTLGILKVASEVCAKLIEGKMGEIEDRPTIMAHLERSATVLTLTAKVLDGDGTEADEKAIASAMFDAKTDKLDA